MKDIIIPIVSVVLSGMVSIVTAFLTAKLTSDNEMKRSVKEKRQMLYIECYEILTKIKNNLYMAFDYDTVSALKDLVAKMNLIASKYVIEALQPLDEQIDVAYANYFEHFESVESIVQRIERQENEKQNEFDLEIEKEMWGQINEPTTIR